MSAPDYLDLADSFLRLAEAASGELVLSKNRCTVIGTTANIDRYDEITKWSDHQIGVPILFTFFHGVELTLKGFLSIHGTAATSHRLTGLLQKFEKSFPDKQLGHIVADWISPPYDSPLGEFLSTNGITIDSWYTALRYPESTAREEYDHLDLMYRDVYALPFWDSVRRAAREIRDSGGKLYASLESV